MVSDTPVNLVWSTVAAVVLTGVTILLSRGMHAFYDKLKIYHKTPDYYDSIIAYRGSPPGGKEPEYYARPLEIENLNDYDIKPINLLNNKEDPRFIIDFNNMEREYYGEPKSTKFTQLALYIGAASVIPIAIVAAYFTVLTDFVDFGREAYLATIGCIALIFFFHLGIRVSTLAKPFTHDTKAKRLKYQNDFVEFAYSFFMSLLVLWSFTAVIISATGSTGGGSGSIKPKLLIVIGLLIFALPFVMAKLSRKILRWTKVDNKSKRDYKRTEPIAPDE